MINPQGHNYYITKVMFIVTGRYHDMARRSFESHVNQDSLNALGEITQGGQVIPLAGISTIASELVTTSAQIDHMIDIPGGWSEPRLRFMIELVQDYGTSGHDRYIYTGWTDYIGATQSGSIDPNMILHFNGCTRLHDRQIILPNGMRSFETVPTSANQFLTETKAHSGQWTNEIEHLIRPMDIFNHSSVASRIAQMGGDALGLEVHNYASTMATGAQQSSRANNLSSAYIRNSLKAYKNAVNLAGADNYEVDMMEVHSNGAANTIESSMQTDPLVSVFGLMTDIAINMELPWNLLLSQFPEVDQNDVTQILFPGQMQNLSPAFSMDGPDGERWTNQDMETVIAATLSQSVPALMTECLLGKISFALSNDRYSVLDNGLVRYVNPDLTMSLVNLPNLEVYVNRFLDLMESTVFPILSNSGMIQLSISVTSTLYGDTQISVEFNGNPSVQFTFPTFADSLSSHMITLNRSAFNDIHRDMTYIMENVSHYTPRPAY